MLGTLQCGLSSLLCVAVLVVDHVRGASYYSSSLSITDDYYAKITIDVGTPSESFDVLLDTTNSDTWVLNSSVTLSDGQDSFRSSSSKTWSAGTSEFNYTYENGTTNGTMGTDLVTVSSLNLTDEKIGLASYNQEFFQDEEVSGALSLCRTSNVMKNLASNDEVEAAFTLNIESKELHIGEYSTSYKNSTEVSAVTDVSSVEDYWAFSFDSMTASSAALLTCSSSDCYGIIDSASPYLTFAISSDDFDTIWKNIGGSGNCEKSTLECDSKSDIATYIEFEIGNDTYYMERDDYYYDSQLHILRTDTLASGITAIYFGRPLLKTMDVTLNAVNDTITFNYSTTSGDTGKWTTVWIVAICVAVFAGLFFGLFFWKFKIPPPTQGVHEEQVETRALLHGAPALAQAHDPLGPPQSRPEAPPAPVSGPPQAVGSSTGASQPTDPDEIRRRRLQFLESQQQQEDQQ